MKSKFLATGLGILLALSSSTLAHSTGVPVDQRNSKAIEKNILTFTDLINFEGKRVATSKLSKKVISSEYKKIWSWGKSRGLDISIPVYKSGEGIKYSKVAGYTRFIEVKAKNGLSYCLVEDSIFGKSIKEDPLHQSLYPSECSNVIKVGK